MKTIVITGGHHSSALPVISKIQNNHPDIKIVWFGHKHSLKGSRDETLEYKEITSLGIPFYDLKAGKFYKTYDPVRLAKIPFGILQALYFLLKVRPSVILSFGGYLSVPTVIAGWLLRIPSLTHEQTLVVGYANKVVSLFAKRILLSWPESGEYFRNQSKLVLSGLPLRESIFNCSKDPYDLNPNLPTLYITAGKTGAKLLNDSVFSVLEDLLNEFNVIHQCGSHSKYDYFGNLSAKHREIVGNTTGKYVLKEFIFEDEIGCAFGSADIVLSRSGAHTTMELLVLKKPALLVPISWVSHDEQNKNAQLLSDLGLGKILDENTLKSELSDSRFTPSLMVALRDIKEDLNSYTISDDTVSSHYKPDAADLILQEVLNFI
jgi:UDP-N-acetylglucosamine--N-acetylmuramyl-(pentapeptide) pyrophosphoryl-undecaprenol N-acetylglucosamine transferase